MNRLAPGAARLAPYLFLSPFIVLTAVFFIYPFIDALQLAFQQTNGPSTRVFVGWDNFRFLAGSQDFHKAVANTLIFAAAKVLLLLPLSLGLALLLNSGASRVKGVFRLILFSPHLVGQIFVGIIFAVIFTPRYGLLNRFLHDLLGWGLEMRWLQNPELVMPAIVLATIWLQIGYNMIYFLAALQNVDESLVEAARIDGAGAWGVFLNVTLPSIKPIALFVLVINTISAFQLFELPYALLRGYGPANSGLTMVGYLYMNAFETGDLGLGAAIGWSLALLILGVSLLQIRLTKNWASDA
jgi:ABC-type sugar transport system permease subunit